MTKSKCPKCATETKNDMCDELGDFYVFEHNVGMNLYPEVEPTYKCPTTVEGRLRAISEAYELLQACRKEHEESK